jgi:hypothetical protein
VIELLPHLFVWIVSPAAVLGIALYAFVKQRYFLGALASLGALMTCALIAGAMFDGHLLFYNLIYSLLLAVPLLLGIVAIGSGARLLLTATLRCFGKDVGPNDVQ